MRLSHSISDFLGDTLIKAILLSHELQLYRDEVCLPHPHSVTNPTLCLPLEKKSDSKNIRNSKSIATLVRLSEQFSKILNNTDIINHQWLRKTWHDRSCYNRRERKTIKQKLSKCKCVKPYTNAWTKVPYDRQVEDLKLDVSSLHVLRPSSEIRFPTICSGSTATSVKEIHMTPGWECNVEKDTGHLMCLLSSWATSWGNHRTGKNYSFFSFTVPLSHHYRHHNAHLRCWDLTNRDRRTTWEELRLWNETSLGLNLIPVTSYL